MTGARRSKPTLALAAAVIIGPWSAFGAVRLSLHDARLLVEHTPIFRSAEAEGLCPQTSDAALNGASATIVLRGGCRDYSWIGDLYVDVLTGEIRMDTPGGQRAIETSELEQLRRTLFRERSDSRISPQEALCIARHVTIQDIPRSCERAAVATEEDEAVAVTLSNGCAAEPGAKPVTVVIDRYTGLVHDAATGRVLASAEILGEDTAAAHSAPRITPTLATRLLKSTAAAGLLEAAGLIASAACPNVEVSPLSNSDEVWLEVSSGCGPASRTVTLSINAATGEVRAIQPNRPANALSVARLREMALEAAKAARDQAIKVVEGACR